MHYAHPFAHNNSIMSSVQTILDISVVFWVLPPFRQFKGRFFYYFLILALSDPITIFCVEILKVPLYSIHSLAGLFLISSLLFFTGKFENKYILSIPILVGFIFGIFYLKNLLILVIITHLIVFLMFVKVAILPIYREGIINIFHFALLFYELSIVLNLSVFIGQSDMRILIYYMTLFFQILLAIFFTIFTENSNSLIIHLKEADSSL